MSERDGMEGIDRLLRERLLECWFRLEKLERAAFGIEAEVRHGRMPQISSPEDIDAAQEDILRRLNLLEEAAGIDE